MGPRKFQGNLRFHLAQMNGCISPWKMNMETYNMMVWFRWLFFSIGWFFGFNMLIFRGVNLWRSVVVSTIYIFYIYPPDVFLGGNGIQVDLTHSSQVGGPTTNYRWSIFPVPWRLVDGSELRGGGRIAGSLFQNRMILDIKKEISKMSVRSFHSPQQKIPVKMRPLKVSLGN